MGQSYKVKIYSSAEQDLLDVIGYLNTLSPTAAAQYYDRLVEGINSLSKMPYRCPQPRDLALAAKGYRYLVVKDYLVFYTVQGDTVRIHRILYGRSDYQSIL